MCFLYQCLAGGPAGLAADRGHPGLGLKIFETSGTPAGQRTAFDLLDPGAHLAVVGFTMEKVKPQQL